MNVITKLSLKAYFSYCPVHPSFSANFLLVCCTFQLEYLKAEMTSLVLYIVSIWTGIIIKVIIIYQEFYLIFQL